MVSLVFQHTWEAQNQWKGDAGKSIFYFLGIHLHWELSVQRNSHDYWNLSVFEKLSFCGNILDLPLKMHFSEAHFSMITDSFIFSDEHSAWNSSSLEGGEIAVEVHPAFWDTLRVRGDCHEPSGNSVCGRKKPTLKIFINSPAASRGSQTAPAISSNLIHAMSVFNFLSCCC